MSAELSLTLHDNEGALLRVLGTLERRGFRVLAVHGEARGGKTELRLKVDGQGRCIEVMMRQLQRLYDVQEVRRAVPLRPLRVEIRTPLRPKSRRALDFLGIPEPHHETIRVSA